MFGKHARWKWKAPDRGGIARNSLAQVSFAVVAVVILTATAITGTYLAKKELDSRRAEKQQRLVESMEAEAMVVVDELGLYASFCAQQVMTGWNEYPVNESRISDAFSSRMDQYIVASFPRTKADKVVEVRNWSGGLFFVERKTLDLVPPEGTKPAQLQQDGVVMQYDRAPDQSDEVLSERTVNPFYVALGNFSIRVSAEEVSLERGASFQRPVVSALPFLETKLRAFESATDGELSDLGNMVSYMLSTLGQLRVLEGYGQPMYSHDRNTSQILTEEDVYRAVLVAFMLEQARLFRTIDRRFATEVCRSCGGENPGIAALLSPNDRYLDPAELFLWFLRKTEVVLDPSMIVAQSMYGLADLTAMRLMEYMGWLGMMDCASVVLDSLETTLDSLISFFTGEDKAKIAVVAWIEKTARAAGANDSSFSRVFAAPVDFSLSIPERQYFVQDAEGFLYPVWVGNMTASVDIPQCDLLSSDVWADFYSTFRECQRSCSSTMRDACMRLAFDIGLSAEQEFEALSVDPTDQKDIFSSLAENAASVSLAMSRDGVCRAARNLPLFSSQYELAGEFSEFVRREAGRIADVDELMFGVRSCLADAVVSSARYAYIPNLVVPVEQQLRDIITADVATDSSWGVDHASKSILENIVHLALSRLQLIVNASVLRLDDGFAGPAVDAVAGLILDGCEEFPGLGDMLESTLSSWSREVIRQAHLSSFKHKVYVGIGKPFEFWDGDRVASERQGSVLNTSLEVEIPKVPALRAIPYDERSGYDSLEHLFPTDDLLVQVRSPWDFDRKSSEYPNVHLTSLGNATPASYATQWTVSVLGLLDIALSADDNGLHSIVSEKSVESRRKVRVDLELPIVLHSCWPLQGVAYNPSNTLLSDAIDSARKFCAIVWEKLEPVFGWVVDGICWAYKFLADVFDVFATFAGRILRAFTSAMQTLVETLQEYVHKLAESALGRAVQCFVDLMGRVEFRVSLYGFLIIVQTNIPDLIYRHGTDMLRVIVATKRLGPGLSFGIRVARLTDGSFDILANSTITLRKASVEVVVDPLMHILRRFAEMHCKGQGWALDLVMPEVEPYELAEVTTGDMPGIGSFLSNIPIPVLGLSASVEAGMRLKYSPPFPRDVVVNEFESNPTGEDSGKEWVELYNPLTEPRCVDGWSIETLHGRNIAMPIRGTIGPNGVLAFVFPETSLDNGVTGDPFNDGDAVVLRDASGATMDVTPVLGDSDNDDRSWQRAWDGGPRWVFRAGGRGASNGAPVLLAASDFIAKALFEAFKEAFMQTQLEEVTPSLAFLTLFAKRVLNNFIENLLEIVKEIIHEVVFFIKVVVSDGTGSAGVGFRASFVVTGEAIVDLLRWLIHTFATFVVNLGRAHNPMAYPVFPSAFLSGLYVRFELLFEVGLPKMVRLLGAVGSLENRFSCAVAISPNIPALGRLVGKQWGTWSLDFGVYLEGVPKEFVQGFLAIDTGDLVDFWILKGRVYGE